MAQETTFTCFIACHFLGDMFSATVIVRKKAVIKAARQKGKYELADVFIEPVSGHERHVHDHFVLFDLTGHGLYIARDENQRDIHRRECSIWDFGQSFAIQVLNALKQFA